MASQRRIVFTNDHWYHVFNRGIEGRQLFFTRRDYERFLLVLYYYQFSSIPIRYSHYKELNPMLQGTLIERMERSSKKITIAAYCLMPNHFHLLIRQNMDDGIPRYLSDVSNSFSKYFNTKNQRTGPLFQGIFKGVYVESDEQFVHVSRYIHLNPFDASLCNLDTISGYPWSSLSCYTHGESDMLVDTSFLSGYFLKPESYQRFIKDHIEVTKKNREFESLLLDRE